MREERERKRERERERKREIIIQFYIQLCFFQRLSVHQWNVSLSHSFSLPSPTGIEQDQNTQEQVHPWTVSAFRERERERHSKEQQRKGCCGRERNRQSSLWLRRGEGP